MDVKLTKKPIPSVTVAGEVDLSNADRVEAAIKQASETGPDIILNLSEATYLDSAGANLVFVACRLASKRNGHVALVVKNKNVRRMLEVLGADCVPNVALREGLADAMKALGVTD